jgi:hypothetical protein
MSQYIVQIIFAVTGIIAVSAAILNWDWFFNSQQARAIARFRGRGHARIFYGSLGVILLAMVIIISLKR